jgi:hypothetical protein
MRQERPKAPGELSKMDDTKTVEITVNFQYIQSFLFTVYFYNVIKNYLD